MSSPSPLDNNYNNETNNKVVILDAGAQYGKIIDRRVRELFIESDLLPLSTPAQLLTQYSAIIISGGPQSVYGLGAPKYDKSIFTLNKPIFGICYGMQLINAVFGGKVEKQLTREDGQFMIQINTPNSLLYKNLNCNEIEVLLTHGDSIGEIAPEFTVSAMSKNGIVASIENEDKRIYGVQYHPEVDLTPLGVKIMQNFLINIAHIKPNFTLQSRLEHAVQQIRKQVGSCSVLCLLSGGVDSSVCAALLKHAIGAERIYAIHIDNGFMRLNESAKVAEALHSIGLNLRVIDAKEDFYNASTTIDNKESEQLKCTVQPEIKRKIVGDTFMKVSENELTRLGLTPAQVYLAQGTLRPDLIESGSSIASQNADVIKTHHNDTALVRALRSAGRIIEPLSDYHKDEVRVLGTELGLPNELVWRQPFPGPGLSIRIICATQPYITPADSTIVNSLNSYSTPSINVSLLPCRTVGVQGDQRSYSHLVALSADYDYNNNSIENLDWSKLFDLAKQIPKHVHGVNRVVFCFGKKLNQNYYDSITPTLLEPECVLQLQQADEIVNRVLIKYDLLKCLSQVPVILFPVNFGIEKARSIAIRTFITNDFMTGVPAFPGKTIKFEALKEMIQSIITQVPDIARVCFDLTTKPPATVEYE